MARIARTKKSLWLSKREAHWAYEEYLIASLISKKYEHSYRKFKDEKITAEQKRAEVRKYYEEQLARIVKAGQLNKRDLATINSRAGKTLIGLAQS
ncbi:MAG: hypothetical protein AAB597_01180 [Patescibacteria group bacterium]